MSATSLIRRFYAFVDVLRGRSGSEIEANELEMFRVSVGNDVAVGVLVGHYSASHRLRPRIKDARIQDRDGVVHIRIVVHEPWPPSSSRPLKPLFPPDNMTL